MEKTEIAKFVESGKISLQLKSPDFATAERIAKAINALHADHAWAVNAGTISIQLPPKLARSQIAGFISKIEALDVEVDQPAVVVIDERTGTIVIGQHVGISPVAISIGSLSIVIEEKDFVSQPLPFSRTGKTATMERTAITAQEQKSPVTVLPTKVSVLELAKALNAMQLTPRGIISIFQALKQANALHAKLLII